ncbi:MAG: hypothetical protein A2X61_06925 [Ignavibacteria bacterium GWB2_35_12]|nr:MAG: hypothetical protein A2X61_06925 [Ignavibacteria bacterium GWB2_35_12]OGU87395.1 MAG: hypothetical protein A2220_01275 [Ignavibacteria bacterium RIFOXYA2_FULL_35_10]OGV22042.1 MAG: hypothetical protein A2475_09425 [Ignavibacteria bacterium RIFOXYC2_FULL_35_21]
MKIRYDKEVDVFNLQLSDAEIVETDEVKPGLIIDYNKNGNIVNIEIINASKHISHPNKVEYEFA